jgi:hypothetical protein
MPDRQGGAQEQALFKPSSRRTVFVIESVAKDEGKTVLVGK